MPSDVVERADVRMRERGDGLGFALEPRAELGIRGEFRGEDLDGDGAVEPCIPRPVHLAHAAGAEAGRRFRKARASSLESTWRNVCRIVTGLSPEPPKSPAVLCERRDFERVGHVGHKGAGIDTSAAASSFAHLPSRQTHPTDLPDLDLLDLSTYSTYPTYPTYPPTYPAQSGLA